MKKIMLTFAITSVLIGCEKQGALVKQAAVYPVATLDTASAMVYTDYVAEIQSGTVVEIRPRVSGYIDKILVEEGSRVSRGQALFQINQADLVEQYNAAVANVDAAKAKVDNAELEVRKLTPLVDKNIISAYELTSAKSNLDAVIAGHKAAVSQMRNAEINLGYATITAPVSGVVGRIIVREGTLVSTTSPDPLTSVSGDGDVSAYFSIDENSVLDMVENMEGRNLREKLSRIPMTINLLLSNGTMYEHAGKLDLASGLVNMTTGSYQIKGVFPNPDNKLRSGSSGVVRISENLNGVILVPQKATYELQDKKMIYTLDKDNKAVSVALKIEGQSGENYVVSSGVTKGDRVVTEGVDFIKDGDEIHIKN